MAGASVQTLRFYERRGLLPSPPREASGYRVYPAETVERVRFIRKAQALGFTLAEIDVLLRLTLQSPVSCAEARATAMAAIERIDRNMAELRRFRRALDQVARQCVRPRRTGSCPLLDELEARG